MEKIHFTFLGFDLLEPMSLLLNWLMMVQCFLYYRHLKSAKSNNFVVFWKWFFFFFSISFFGGGLAHTAFNYFGQIGKVPGWLSGMAGITCLQLAMVMEWRHRYQRLLRSVVVLQVLVLSVLTIHTLNFTFVILHTATILFFIGVPAITTTLKGSKKNSWFLLGLLCLVAALPVKLLEIDPHLWFNRDDLSHVFMILSLHFYFRGAQSHARRQGEVVANE